ncbi:MAG: hypothetical protein ACRYFU_26795 [Janthinobacterium lividum]
MRYASRILLNSNMVQRVAVAVSVPLFILSFFLPAILFRSVKLHESKYLPSGDMQVYSGSSMAMVSVFGPLSLNFAGVANPLWIAGCALLLARKSRPARLSLVLAALLALQTFQLRIQPLPYDEGEMVQGLLVHPLIGWYTWFTALLLPLVCSFMPTADPKQKAKAYLSGNPHT